MVLAPDGYYALWEKDKDGFSKSNVTDDQGISIRILNGYIQDLQSYYRS